MQSFLPLLMGIMASASSGKSRKYVSVSCPAHPEPSNWSGEHACVLIFLKYVFKIYVWFTNISEAFCVTQIRVCTRYQLVIHTGCRIVTMEPSCCVFHGMNSRPCCQGGSENSLLQLLWILCRIMRCCKASVRFFLVHKLWTTLMIYSSSANSWISIGAHKGLCCLD